MIYLYGLKQLSGERTIFGLFHLLKGKKSSQVIQDGKLFGLSNLFGTMPHITYAEFKSTIHQLFHQELVLINDKSQAVISETGLSRMNDSLSKHPLPIHLNGWKYGDISRTFWRRFTLFIQTLSHLLEGEPNFYPIQNEPDILSWVKEYFPKDHSHRVGASELLYTELFEFLSMLDKRDAENIVHRLTRHGKIGKTSLQIAQELRMDPIECDFRFQGILHNLMAYLLKDPIGVPGLYLFITDLDKPYTLTNSTLKTFKLLQKGYAKEEIAASRELKTSTIEDHIVEIVIHVPNFPIESFISESDQKAIIETSTTMNTKRLKAIKERLEERYSYFQIRLTLASIDDQSSKSKERNVTIVN